VDLPGGFQRGNLGAGHREVIELAEEPLTVQQAQARAPRGDWTENNSRCRSEVHLGGAPRSWTLLALVFIAALGAWIGRSVILDAPDAARFTQGNRVALELWAALMAGLCGYGLAAGVVMTGWLRQVLKTFTPAASFRGWVRWALVTALVLVMVMLAPAGIPAGAVGGRPVHLFFRQIVAIAVAGAVIAVPGLVGFLAVRSLARNDDQWHEEPRCQVLMVLSLRQHLRRLLGTFGLLLTLLVVATAARRQLVLTFYKNSTFPQEFVLLYGLLFASMLALFHVSATMAIDGRCQRLLARYAPIPDPGAEDISTPLRRRQDLAALLAVGGSWQQSFQNGIVVFAPLLTALIGTALHK
jgi:hypothetical protein